MLREVVLMGGFFFAVFHWPPASLVIDNQHMTEQLLTLTSSLSVSLQRLYPSLWTYIIHWAISHLLTAAALTAQGSKSCLRQRHNRDNPARTTNNSANPGLLTHIVFGWHGSHTHTHTRENETGPSLKFYSLTDVLQWLWTQVDVSSPTYPDGIGPATPWRHTQPGSHDHANTHVSRHRKLLRILPECQSH